MTEKKLQIVLEAVDKSSAELKKVNDSLTAIDTSAQKTGVSFGKIAGGVAIGTFIFSAISKAAGAFKNLAIESIELSGKLEQSQAVIYQLGSNSGWTKDQINGLVGSIREENKDMLTAIELTKTAIMTNMTEAQALEIVARGRDVAAAANLNSNDAITAMMQSVVKLRPELLSQYGIELNLIKVYGDYADVLNKKTSELTYAEKTQAMYNAMIEQATRTQGSYEQAMDSWYKKLNSTKDGLVDVKIAVGKLLSGAMKPIIDETYNAVRAFNKWSMDSEGNLNPMLQRVSNTISVLVKAAFEVGKAIVSVVVDAFGPMIQAVFGTEKATSNLTLGIKTFGNYLIGIIKSIGFVVTVIIGFARTMISTGKVVYAFIQDGVKNFNSFGENLRKIFKAIGQAMTGNFSEAGDTIKEMFTSTLSNTLDAFNNFGNEQALVSEDINNAWLESGQAWENMINTQNDAATDSVDIFKLLGDVFKAGVTPAVGASGEEAKKLGDAFKEAQDKAMDFAEKSVDSLQQVGDKIIEIQQKMNELTVENVKENVSINQDYANAYVEQEKKVAEIKKELDDKKKEYSQTLTESVDADNLRSHNDKLAQLENERNALIEKLTLESGELERYKTIEIAFSDEVAEVRRRNSLTDISRAIEDLNQKRTLVNQEYEMKYNSMLKELAVETEKYVKIKELQAQGLKDYAAFLASTEKQTVDSVKVQVEALNALASAVARAAQGKATSVNLSLPGRATGGPVTAGQPYIVGEMGPELFVPGNSGSIKPNLSGLGQALNIHITVNGDVSGQELVEKVKDSLMRELSLNQRLALS